MVKKIIMLAAFVIFLQGLFGMNAAAFELRYLHAAGADINYTLEITKKNQTTMLDVNRHINSNDGTDIDLTTNFSNARVVRGGIETPLNNLNGAVSRTVMDDHGVVSLIEPLGTFKAAMDALGLTLERDLMNKLGVSSFPTGDLAVGSSWTKSASKGSTSATFTYTVEQENQAVAGYNTVAVIDIASGEFEITDMKEIVEVKKTTYIKGKVAVDGKLYFDVDAGRIVRLDQAITYHTLNVTADFTGKAVISPDDGVVQATLLIQ